MKMIPFLLCITLLCGCSVLNPYNEDFLCQGKTGYGKCSDMGQAYQENITDNSLVIRDQASLQTLSDSEKNYVSALLESQTKRIQESQTPVIRRPELLRMLMLEYTDNDVLFGSRYVWFFNDKPEWITPLKGGSK